MDPLEMYDQLFENRNREIINVFNELIESFLSIEKKRRYIINVLTVMSTVKEKDNVMDDCLVSANKTMRLIKEAINQFLNGLCCDSPNATTDMSNNISKINNLLSTFDLLNQEAIKELNAAMKRVEKNNEKE